MSRRYQTALQDMVDQLDAAQVVAGHVLLPAAVVAAWLIKHTEALAESARVVKRGRR